jgi:hypothetical protein
MGGTTSTPPASDFSTHGMRKPHFFLYRHGLTPTAAPTAFLLFFAINLITNPSLHPHNGCCSNTQRPRGHFIPYTTLFGDEHTETGAEFSGGGGFLYNLLRNLHNFFVKLGFPCHFSPVPPSLGFNLPGGQA